MLILRAAVRQMSHFRLKSLHIQEVLLHAFHICGIEGRKISLLAVSDYSSVSGFVEQLQKSFVVHSVKTIKNTEG